MKNLSLTILVAAIFSTMAFCQDLTQTVRGTITDVDNNLPLIGVTIIVANSNPFVGTTTDLDGNFRFENLPVGRTTLQLSYMGYESKNIPNIVITTGKEVVLNLELTESALKMDEVVIKASVKKGEAINKMSLISARTISVEETNSYAGSMNDPARMVSSYAGVTNNPLGNNEIIVRGNSPQGILWKLEGVEIPNPNHFSGVGGTGGPISALNSNMLSNSDFFTGAFSPEYGNATSGVFDMKLRKGNNQKRETSIGVSVLGTDITVEGPISSNYSGSYLANYRYSTLGLLCDLGVVEYGGIPRYQDASFKVYLPTKTAGTFSLFGLGGLSSISEETKSDDDIVLQKSESNSSMGVIGLNHTYIFNKKTYLKSSLSLAGNEIEGKWDIRSSDGDFYPAENGKLSKVTSKFTSTLNNKINSKNRINTGLIYTNYAFNYTYDKFIIEDNSSHRLLDEKGNSSLMQAFTSWKHRFNDNLSFTAGVHYTQLMLNNNYSIDPRAALKWKLNSQQSLTFGFGQHSKIESLSTYFAKGYDSETGNEFLNNDLELTKARHYVVGYDNLLSDNLYFKTEVYYQQLYDVPVANDINNPFSVINQMSGMPEVEMVNKGEGSNYGIEMSLEKFLSNNYYFLTTVSLYESKYKPLDGIERETVWNGNYCFNILGGKEFAVGSKSKGRVAFVNAKMAYAGGGLYVPVDLEKSREANKSMYAGELAQSDNFFKMDLTIGVRRNWKKSSHEFKIEVQNVTNNSAMVRQRYDSVKGEISNYTQLPLLPVVSYKIDF